MLEMGVQEAADRSDVALIFFVQISHGLITVEPFYKHTPEIRTPL